MIRLRCWKARGMRRDRICSHRTQQSRTIHTRRGHVAEAFFVVSVNRGMGGLSEGLESFVALRNDNQAHKLAGTMLVGKDPSLVATLTQI